MPLDPQAKVLLEKMKEIGVPPMHTLSPEQARQVFIASRIQPEPEPISHVIDRTIPGPSGDIPVRIYTPGDEGPYPAFVYYHGGGWVVGNLDTHDAVCRRLANLGSFIVVAVDYRLAPEHKFPAALEDAYAAAKWVFEQASSLNADPSRIAVGGDSAGGNLAAVVAKLAKEKETPKLVFQALIYPVTDFSFDTDSYKENAEGYNLTRDSMIWFSGHYLSNDDEKQNPYAAPLRAVDLQGLPPAFIITADYDPLRDEGEAYADRLKKSNVPVVCKRYSGMIHGFVGMSSVLDQGKTALEEIAAALAEAFMVK